MIRRGATTPTAPSLDLSLYQITQFFYISNHPLINSLIKQLTNFFKFESRKRLKISGLEQISTPYQPQGCCPGCVVPLQRGEGRDVEWMQGRVEWRRGRFVLILPFEPPHVRIHARSSLPPKGDRWYACVRVDLFAQRAISFPGCKWASFFFWNLIFFFELIEIGLVHLGWELVLSKDYFY